MATLNYGYLTKIEYQEKTMQLYCTKRDFKFQDKFNAVGSGLNGPDCRLP